MYMASHTLLYIYIYIMLAMVKAVAMNLCMVLAAITTL